MPLLSTSFDKPPPRRRPSPLSACTTNDCCRSGFSPVELKVDLGWAYGYPFLPAPCLRHVDRSITLQFSFLAGNTNKVYNASLSSESQVPVKSLRLEPSRQTCLQAKPELLYGLNPGSRAPRTNHNYTYYALFILQGGSMP